MKLELIAFLILFCFLKSNTYPQSDTPVVYNMSFKDSSRNRNIPVTIYRKNDNNFTANHIVIISPGYGEQTTSYSFIANKLAAYGYLVISIGHDLPTDEPLAREGNIYELRLPVWQRGVENIQFILKEMQKLYKQIDYNKVILIGHSNGGDISLLFTKEYSQQVLAVITLDHRRMPIPLITGIRILSIRADEFPAENGLIPGKEISDKYSIKIVKLQNTKHNDLTDIGTDELKQRINKEILNFLNNAKL